MKYFKMILKVLLVIILIIIVYVVGNILLGYFTKFKPSEKTAIMVDAPIEGTITDSSFTCMIWNIGYAGLGKEENFFYDGGKMVRPSRERVDTNLNGIIRFLQKQTDVDFLMIQEIDSQSKRSYYINQYEVIGNNLPQYNRSYAMNFWVKYHPMPLERPWDVMGKVTAGMATYSKYTPMDVVRHQLPGAFPFPKNLYMLDRCLLVQRYKLTNGKQLIIINLHNSAYDNTGELKAKEMGYLKQLILKEYEQGNYVVAGGDWNQNPPGFDNMTFAKGIKEPYHQTNVANDFMPDGWAWAYDATTPTNRNLVTAYNPSTTFTTLIDFFLVSPNLEVVEVKGQQLNFEFSDHQPVKLRVRFK
ncbi:MAG: endonuclease/exonuclease/phosphatase family protein [Chitinophagales bacterium]|nr:endonuclease/exonuclease/phosphatase family protein [Chitinophagales bacterium]